MDQPPAVVVHADKEALSPKWDGLSVVLPAAAPSLGYIGAERRELPGEAARLLDALGLPATHGAYGAAAGRLQEWSRQAHDFCVEANRLQHSAYPYGAGPGDFEAAPVLCYRVRKTAPAAETICKALGLSDPGQITPAQLTSLQAANPQLAAGSLQTAIPAGAVLHLPDSVDAPAAIRYRALQQHTLQGVLASLAANAGLPEQERLRVVDYAAAFGSIAESLDRRWASALRQRTAEACSSAAMAESSGAFSRAIDCYAAATANAEQLVRVSKEPEARSDGLAFSRTARERARALLPTALGTQLELDPAGHEYAHAIATAVRKIFTGPEASLLIGECYAARERVDYDLKLLEPGKSSPEIARICHEKALEHYRRVLQELDVPPAAEMDLPRLAADQRQTAHRAVDYLMRDALQQRREEQRRELTALKCRLIALENDPLEKGVLQRELAIALLPAIFRQPAEFKDESVLKSIGIPERGPLSKARYQALLLRRANEMLTATSADLQKAADETARIGKLLESEKRAPQRAQLDEAAYAVLVRHERLWSCLSYGQLALRSMLIQAVIESPRGAVKRDYYGQLDALNNSVRAEEQKRVEALEQSRSALEREIVQGGALTFGTQQVQREAIQLLHREVGRLRRSHAQLCVEQAETAIAARDPKLTRRVPALMNMLEPLAKTDPAAGRLLAQFKNTNQTGQWSAACKTFLEEVNRDFPLYTLGLMIAGGLIGAGLAAYGRRSGGIGFLIGSCAVLGTTKLFYGLSGIDMIAAARATGISGQSVQQTAMNVMYLGTDLVQTLPIVGGLIALWRSQAGREPELSDLLRDAERRAGGGLPGLIWQEAAATIKSLPQAIRGLPSWTNSVLIGVPVAYGVIQLLTHEMGGYRLEVGKKFAFELAATLAAAIIHDAVQARLRSKQPLPQAEPLPPPPASE